MFLCVKNSRFLKFVQKQNKAVQEILDQNQVALIEKISNLEAVGKLNMNFHENTTNEEHYPTVTRQPG